VQSHLIALEQGDFERSFYYNLLLQPPLAMIDTAFFIVDHVEHHLARRREFGQSWLEAAVECGALIPVFRRGTNFTENLSALKRDNFTGLSDQSQEPGNLSPSQAAPCRVGVRQKAF
jgi:hypothetical protein